MQSQLRRTGHETKERSTWSSTAAIASGWLGGDSDPYPAFWTPGHDSDHDGILNERDARPRNPFPS